MDIFPQTVGKGLSTLLLVRVVNCLGKCKETKEINPNQDRLDCDSKTEFEQVAGPEEMAGTNSAWPEWSQDGVFSW